MQGPSLDTFLGKQESITMFAVSKQTSFACQANSSHTRGKCSPSKYATLTSQTNMAKKLAAIILAVGLYNALFFATGFPVEGSWGFFFFILSIHTFLWLAFSPKLWNKKHTYALSLTFLALCSTSLALYRASPTDTSLLALLSLTLSVVTLYFLSLSHFDFGAVSEIIAIPFIQAKSWLDKAVDLVSRPPLPRAQLYGANFPNFPKLPNFPQSTWFAILRGIAITVPLALVIIFLLVNADPIFSKFTGDLFKSLTPNVTLLQRLIGSVAIIVITAPIAFMSIRYRYRSPLNHPALSTHGIDIGIATTSVALILAGFLLVQFRYIFASVPESDLHQFGINTYSEYVRKGFVEMLLVSAIVYAVIGMSLIVYRLRPTQKLLKTINLILLGETTVFLFSILRRVYLYQTTHGLTRIRIYGTSFVLMMLALTIILTLRHLVRRRFPWYLAETGLITLAVLLTVLANPDHLIATRFHPTVNQETDYVYISRLSASSADGWVEAYTWAESAVNAYTQTPVDQLTQNQVRHFRYANMIIYNLHGKYIRLTRQYGTEAELKELQPELVSLKPGSALQQAFAKNNATHQAYLILSAKIPRSKLHQLFVQTTNASTTIPQNLHQPLDRSQESPLVD